MSSYKIQRGDSLSSLARRFHSSVSELLKANPQIQNANLIYAGNTLQIPGSKDEFVDSPARRAGDARPTPEAATVGGHPQIRRGATGPAVQQLQLALKKHGFDPGPADGDFGPRTEAAVRSFQLAHGLSTDGVVGPRTWAALDRAPSAHPPAPPPVTPPAPGGGNDPISSITPAQLAQIGATDKARFFALLKPAALEAERKFGVPWQVTLAQAAVESGWGKHAIGGFNIFGIKGSGPAGSVSVQTQEYVNGRYITITDRFAKYHDFGEAIAQHGKVFHNGYYNKALNQFARDHSPVAFAQNIHGIYATSPTYAPTLISIMRQYGLI